mmetsp:Transcript_29218/g.40642  ORF Transcript_29218/g.40642 Transcript_29218/m.40642 type:complete len:167 (-) Transcript_29218:1239-1739(-)
MLSVKNTYKIFEQNDLNQNLVRKISHFDSDHLTLLNVYNLWRIKKKSKPWVDKYLLNYKLLEAAEKLKIKLAHLFDKIGVKVKSNFIYDSTYFSNIRKTIFKGFFLQTASHLHQNIYKTLIDNHMITLHPYSTLQGPCKYICFNNLLLSTKLYTCLNSKVDKNWVN